MNHRKLSKEELFWKRLLCNPKRCKYCMERNITIIKKQGQTNTVNLSLICLRNWKDDGKYWHPPLGKCRGVCQYFDEGED